MRLINRIEDLNAGVLTLAAAGDITLPAIPLDGDATKRGIILVFYIDIGTTPSGGTKSELNVVPASAISGGIDGVTAVDNWPIGRAAGAFAAAEEILSSPVGNRVLYAAGLGTTLLSPLPATAVIPWIDNDRTAGTITKITVEIYGD